VKKKYTPTIKDKKDWVDFTKNLKNIYDKDLNKIQGNIIKKKIKKLDLHGLTLVQANRAVKKFIIQCFEEGYKNLLIITGKGIRSKVQNNPYLSEKMSVLKYSVPEFLKSDKELLNKIKDIKTAEIKDGGEGAFYIFLKQKKLQDKF
tara:strand:+ start:2283 stop:2723 length:441 start_codon:yes stop_codon:yes gene_type:complete